MNTMKQMHAQTVYTGPFFPAASYKGVGTKLGGKVQLLAHALAL